MPRAGNIHSAIDEALEKEEELIRFRYGERNYKAIVDAVIPPFLQFPFDYLIQQMVKVDGEHKFTREALASSFYCMLDFF